MHKSKNPLKKTLRLAIIRILMPLIKILIRYGITYKETAEILKWCYVQAAHSDFQLEERKPSKSRISVITGISRVEVDRLLNEPPPDRQELSERYHRGARVLTGWLENKKYHDKNNTPKPLPIIGKTSFAELVEQYSGGAPHRAVLDELVRVEAVEVTNDKVKLLKRYYIPSFSKSEHETINIIGVSASALLNTLEHNSHPQHDSDYYQRIIMQEDIPVEAIEYFKNYLRKHAQTLADNTDQILTNLKNDSNHTDQQDTKTIGLGIYFFQEDNDSK